MRRVHLLILVLLASTTACVSPVRVGEGSDPALMAIESEFKRIVAEADADESVEWVHGWSGNSAIAGSEQDGSIKGYCYEWQELVYENILPCVKQQGWDLVKININRDWFSEHHAVVVFDRNQITREELLVQEGPGAFVLDAWQEGKAQIFTLDDWLSIPVIVFEPAALEIRPEVHWRP